MWAGGGVRGENSPSFALALSLTTEKDAWEVGEEGEEVNKKRQRGGFALKEPCLILQTKSCWDSNHTEYTTDTRLDREGLSLCSRLDWFDLAPQDLIKLRPKPLEFQQSYCECQALRNGHEQSNLCMCVFMNTHMQRYNNSCRWIYSNKSWQLLCMRDRINFNDNKCNAV